MIDRALYCKYRNKKVNARKEYIEFNLTLEEYASLLEEAGITLEDVGNTGYHLARYNDEGPYEVGNCRFIHYLENLNEKQISEKSRNSSRDKILKIISERTPEERKRIAKLGGKAGGGHNKFSDTDIQERIKIIKESGIDLNKRGYQAKLSRLLGISHTQVRRFMKQYYN